MESGYAQSMVGQSLYARGGAEISATTSKLANIQAGATQETQIRQAAQDFEAVFLTQMFQQMYAGIEVNEVLGGGKSEEIFRGFLLDEYGKEIAKAGGVGIADQVQRELIGLQAAATK